MSTGPDRRTFVRGAAATVGLGAVGGLAPRGVFALPSLPDTVEQEADSPDPVEITVRLEKVGKGGAQKLTCPDAEAQATDEIQWKGDGVSIRLIQFKGGRSPFDWIELPSDGNPPGQQPKTGVEHGRYSYLIVAEKGGKVYALDPDLDIVG